MATSTTTIRPITITCVVCGSEGECFHGLFSFDRLYRAYVECRKNKRNTINALKFEADLYANLHRLSEELQDGSYAPSRSLCFVARKPKLREIFAADFCDRVVHHLLVGALQPYFEPSWIHDSFACRRDKGTHAAVARLNAFIRQATRNRKRPAYYLQLDIRSFFMSIHKPTLFRLVERRLIGGQQLALPGFSREPSAPRREELLRLAKTIIYNDPTEHYVYKGDPRLLAAVPAHKSLFGVPKDRGLPIGNLTSQFFAGVYLNELDQFVKRRMQLKWYIRYVDDLVILADSPERFDDWSQNIDDFLAANLRLHLNPNARHQGRVSDGIDFLGYLTRPSHTLVRRRVVSQCKQSLLDFERNLVKKTAAFVRFDFDLATLERFLAVLNGYIAHFRRADAKRLLASLSENNAYLRTYFDIGCSTSPTEKGYAIRRRYPIRADGMTLAAQVAAVRRLRPGEGLFVRVGAYFELYDRDAQMDLGLRTLPARRGFRRRCGFPARSLDRYLDRAMAMGQAVAVVEEHPERLGALKIRRLSYTVVPHGSL